MYIQANAFQQFPNLRILSLETERYIDPDAIECLNILVKFITKEPKSASLFELLQKVLTVAEFETNIEK